MIRSMTGFASLGGALAPHRWSWELRSVNGKGLDLRLRVPDWIEGLEGDLRALLGKAAARGNLTLGLRITRDEAQSSLAVNPAQLDAVLTALAMVEAQAKDAGIALAPASASDVLGVRGVLEQVIEVDDASALKSALLQEVPQLIQAFNQMRDTEGAALHGLLTAQLQQIETLTHKAQVAAADRSPQVKAQMARALAAVMENTDGTDPQRIAQELALIAVKSDITEEIDRLGAHVAAARDLLQGPSPIGRKLDFLMQEFNREANTLCAKAQNSALTQIGLALKAVIDQMREQVQNVE